jgi:UDP-N-acetylglucosamine acyltransferase
VTRIDTTARVADGAIVGRDVEIGPGCIIGRDVVLGDGCRLIANVHMAGRTEIGAETVIHPFAVLGGPPQSLAYRSEPTRLVVGRRCTIRESVTMSVGTADGGGITSVGDDCYFMALSHVAHDCIVGNGVIFANGATLAGHCEIGDNAFLSGHVAVHQFTRIGSGVIAGGGAIVIGDVVPFAMAVGNPARLIGINVVGMRRRKHTARSIAAAKSAYRGLFLGAGNLADRIAAVEAEYGQDPTVAMMLAFLHAPRRRPLCQARRGREETAD